MSTSEKEKIDFNRVVFALHDDGKVEEVVFKELCKRYAFKRETPLGLQDEHQVEGCDLKHWFGNKLKLIQTYPNEEEAQYALMLTWLADFDFVDGSPECFDSKEELEAELNRYDDLKIVD